MTQKLGTCEEGAQPFQFGEGRFDALIQQMREFRLDLPRIFLRAKFMDEDLDARLVLVVAATVAVVYAQAGFGIRHELVERYEVADARCNHRRAAHAATDIECRAQSAIFRYDLDADIVQLHRRAIGLAGNDADLELARQIAEFGMEAGPLAKQLGIGARVHDLVLRGTGKMVAADIADAVSAGLDSVHFVLCQIGQQVARFLQLDPVVLDVLARGEMPISPVVSFGDIGQRVHLPAIQRAIGNGDAQHIGVQLQVKAVHQPQRLELVLGQLAVQPPLALVAKFGHARVDHRLVVMVVFIHQITSRTAAGSSGLRVRSGRTVGPRPRMRSFTWAGRGVPSASGAAATM